MSINRPAASKVYKGTKYKDDDPLKYYYMGTNEATLHEYTRQQLLKYLEMLAAKGEKENFIAIKKNLSKNDNAKYFVNCYTLMYNNLFVY